jgi:GntR family transcriptional regulator, transcriptional repressor for pyruvate dehydrogenase complex
VAQEFVPIHRQRTFEQILEQLQGMILRGELRPGDRLPNERSLAEQLGVGRPSLREALRVLEALEVVEVRPGLGAASGTVITERLGTALPGLLSMQMALGRFTPDELIETRLVLEVWTVRTAATNRTKAQLDAIGALLAELESHESDRETYLGIDARFHLAIADAAGNALLAHLMEGLRVPMEQHMVAHTDTWDDWDAVIRWAAPDHRALFAAIAAKDPDAAEAALRHHLAFYSHPAP